MTFKDLQKLVHSKPNTESNALFDRLCIPYNRIIGLLFCLQTLSIMILRLQTIFSKFTIKSIKGYKQT